MSTPAEVPSLDRAKQRELLSLLRAEYPDSVNIQGRPDHEEASRNLLYLEEHDLVKNNTSKAMNASASVIMSKITAKGIDFLAEDGGLTAVLGVVTVRLEAESIRALITARLDQADVPAPQRTSLKAALHTMSSEALKTLTKRLVEEALLRGPNAVQLLRTWLDSAN